MFVIQASSLWDFCYGRTKTVSHTEVFSMTESDFCLEVITLAAEWKAEAELPEPPSRRTVSWTCKIAMKIGLESTRTPFTWCSGKSIDSALRDG